MAKFSTRFKVKVVLICIGVIILLAFYSYFIPDTVQTRITDAQMAKVDGRFMIATEYRPFVNYDAKYRFKFNSGTVQNEAVRLKGKETTIRKYGWRIPLFSMYENVVSIKEVKWVVNSCKAKGKGILRPVSNSRNRNILGRPWSYKTADYVPISALRKNISNEKYINPFDDYGCKPKSVLTGFELTHRVSK